MAVPLTTFIIVEMIFHKIARMENQIISESDDFTVSRK